MISCEIMWDVKFNEKTKPNQRNNQLFKNNIRQASISVTEFTVYLLKIKGE